MNGLHNYLTMEAQFFLIWHAVDDLKQLNIFLSFSSNVIIRSICDDGCHSEPTLNVL